MPHDRARAGSRGAGVELTKHHGLGNDFLVLLDLAGEHPVAPAGVVALCDRRRGIGADGFIRAVAPGPGDGADLRMELYNADGSVAEMSGNGLRCLAQAAFAGGVASSPEFVVATGAGRRRVEVREGPVPGEVLVRAGMGAVEVSPSPEHVEVGAGPGGGRRWEWDGLRIKVGNPHLVLPERGLDSVDLDLLGPALSAGGDGRPEGNVEWACASSPGEIEMVVWERGAGRTEACGTGSVAVAAAGREWGWVGSDGPSSRVVVHNPGGDLEVELEGDEAFLTGPACLTARIAVDLPVRADGGRRR